MKKWILLLIGSLFLLTGCSTYTELNDLSIVNTVGIEKVNDIYKVTISVVDTSNYENEANYKTTLYDATGKNITEAFNNLYLYLDKEIYIYHLETLLLSSSLDKSDIDKVNDYFNNIKNNRNSFLVVYTRDSISDILHLPIRINNLIKTNGNNLSQVAPLTYEKYLKNLYEHKYSFIPTITYSEEKKEVNVVGYSYFYLNKFINSLTKEESLSYNILNNQVKTLTLSIDLKYYAVNTLECNIQKNNQTYDIHVDSFIYSTEKDYIKKYDTYIKNNLDLFINKYSYFDKYKISLNTKGENYEK